MFVSCIFLIVFGFIGNVSCSLPSSSPYYLVTCRPTDYFIRDPMDCRMYYQCIFAIPMKMKCTNGLCFNSMTDMCDWCDLVPECNKTLMSEKPVQTTQKSDPDSPSMPCPVMNISIFLGHPHDCTKFYYCKRNQLIGAIGYCAEGLWFNFWKQRCEIPWEQRCKKSSLR